MKKNRKKIKNGFALHGEGWHGSLGVTAIVISFIAIIWLLLLSTAKTDFEMGCDITDIEWVMIEEGQQCWLYDASEVQTTWKTPLISRGDTIWELQWDETKHCPLPKNIKCEGKGNIELPFALASNILRKD